MTLSFNPPDRFQPEKESFIYLYILFRLNVAFNNLSFISQRCLDVTGSSMLTLRMLPRGGGVCVCVGGGGGGGGGGGNFLYMM